MQMKTNLLSFALLLVSVAAFAQIQLEHTYPKGWLTRLETDVSGERYMWVSNVQPTIVRIYDADHSDNGISFEPFGTNNALRLAAAPFLSEKLLDDDFDMELLTPWYYDGEDVFGTILVQESGAADAFHCASAFVSLGVAPKLFCYGKVYSLPDLALEHDYIGFHNIRRMEFPIGDERYLLTKGYSSYDGIHIYDAGHNWLKTFKTDFDDITPYNYFISQQYFNDDPFYELCGNKAASTPDANGNNKLFQVVQDDGTVLLSEECISGDLSPAGIRLLYYSAPGQLSTKFLDNKSYASLYNFQGSVVAFSPDGLKDYFRLITSPADTVVLIDGDTYQAKSIPLGYPATDLQFARNRFEKNGKLEIFFSAPPGPNSPLKKIVWMNEDGALLRVFENGVDAAIDKQAGLQDKLFVKYADSTQVYSFSTASTAIPSLPASNVLTAYPNPFSKSFELIFVSPGDYKVTLTNQIGQHILTQTIENQGKAALDFPENASNGIYFVTVEGERFAKCIRVLKLKH